MNVSALALERFHSEMKDKKLEIEGALALGFPPLKAVERFLRNSARSAMIPTTNMLKIVGLIQLPGAMVGMLIAGAPPLEAAKIQLMVVYMLASSNTLAVVVVSLFSYRVYFTRSAQLIEGI